MKPNLEDFRKIVWVGADPPLKLSVIDTGKGDREKTLIFLHGVGGRALHWTRQLEFFFDKYRLIAFDLRGHGFSDKPTSSYTVEEMLSDLSKALEVLKVSEKVIILGHSFGAALALEFAVLHPEKIEKLILINVSSSFMLSPVLKLTCILPISILKIIKAILSRHLFAPPYVLKNYLNNAVFKWNGSPLFEKIEIPTLVIAGQWDTITLRSDAKKIVKEMPNARLDTISYSGHLLIFERPDAVNRSIQRFLEPKIQTWRESFEEPEV
ncbi:MAG: alpha/beta fold hydrolase [Candidatus Methanofastidiosia archaeon]